MWADRGWMSAPPEESPNRVEEALFDATRGYPGEGPTGVRRASTRGVQKQDLRVRVEKRTALRYVQKLRLLAEWLKENRLPTVEELQQMDLRVVNKVLGSYIQYLHLNDRPTQWGTDTLAGVQFAAPSLQ
eukprot:5467727-Amphidinium_carterae.1